MTYIIKVPLHKQGFQAFCWLQKKRRTYAAVCLALKNEWICKKIWWYEDYVFFGERWKIIDKIQWNTMNTAKLKI